MKNIIFLKSSIQDHKKIIELINKKNYQEYFTVMDLDTWSREKIDNFKTTIQPKKLEYEKRTKKTFTIPCMILEKNSEFYVGIDTLLDYITHYNNITCNVKIVYDNKELQNLITKPNFQDNELKKYTKLFMCKTCNNYAYKIPEGNIYFCKVCNKNVNSVEEKLDLDNY